MQNELIKAVNDWRNTRISLIKSIEKGSELAVALYELDNDHIERLRSIGIWR